MLLLSLASAFGQNRQYDLIITNAQVLDVRTGIITKDQNILIHNGRIEKLTDGSNVYSAKRAIDAKGKLVTPAFIDTHIHPTDVFGDYKKAPAFLAKDALKNLRKKLSDEYLPFGTTTVLTMGQPENWLAPLLSWQKNQNASYTDLYISGGALISKEKRTPYIAHTTVETPESAKQKILEYHRKGIHRVKLYYRLQRPEFITAYKIADSLGMGIYGHISDFSSDYLTINETLAIGLINYEHLAAIPNTIITSETDKTQFDKQFKAHFGEINTEARFLECYLEQFRFIEENKPAEMDAFIVALAQKKATFSTTIHRLYEQFQPTYYTRPADILLTEDQTKRCLQNFSILMKYAKKMQDKGIEIRLGSDGPNGGKVNISELILFCKYGFSVADAFKIATINGAKAINIDQETGTLEKGKLANLLIWDKSPFDDYHNFSLSKTVIKNGKIYR
ncbi:Amidohydrolase family protein [Pedobacter steynii]|uniref:Amidohydrolase family protein n=1 Tax=Pedobacter steynii TaxID=430522 RepID=A0A1G9X9F4_9SPHI|nr:amidohydrolase family protein [Pedobacter steynii]NQX40518.1 amidohydrolase family protein [Pedobacter steynii]SDM93151.1 Amidohydrolase family protein [Pedobacter steynii]